MYVGTSFRLIQRTRRLHDEVILRPDIIGVARQRNARVLAQLKRNVVHPIQQLKDGLKCVIAIRAMHSYMQEQIKLGRRADVNPCHGRVLKSHFVIITMISV